MRTPLLCVISLLFSTVCVAQESAADTVLSIRAFADSAELHQALLQAPPPPKAVPSAFSVYYSESGEIIRVERLFHTLPNDYANAMVSLIRPHLRSRTPTGDTASVSLRIEGGTAPRMLVVEYRDRQQTGDKPTLRNASATLGRLNNLARSAKVTYPISALILVSAGGTVEEADLSASTGNPSLDSAILRVVRQMEFTPAMSKGSAVAVRMQIPSRTAKPAAVE